MGILLLIMLLTSCTYQKSENLMASEKKKFCGGYGYMGNHNLMKCEDSEMVCVIYRGLDRGGISCLKK